MTLMQSEEVEMADAPPTNGLKETSNGKSIAPFIPIPQDAVVCVEHPCIIKNLDRGIRSLGGEYGINKVSDGTVKRKVFHHSWSFFPWLGANGHTSAFTLVKEWDLAGNFWKSSSRAILRPSRLQGTLYGDRH